MLPTSQQQHPQPPLHSGKHLLLERLKLDLHPKRTLNSNNNGSMTKSEGASALSVARSSNLKQKQLLRNNSSNLGMDSSAAVLNRLETPTSAVSTMSAFYESERYMYSSNNNAIQLDSERKILIDASGSEGLHETGFNGQDVLVVIEEDEENGSKNQLLIKVYKSQPVSNGSLNGSVAESVHTIPEYQEKPFHIQVYAKGGRGGKAPNLNPNSLGSKSKFSAPYLFGDISPTSNLFNEHFSSTSFASSSNASTSLSQLNGFDGGDGGNITIVTAQRLKHVLFNIEVNCSGGEGGEAGTTQFESKRGMPLRDSFQFPAEVPLSTSVTSSEVLTFSQLSFYNPTKEAAKIRDSHDSFIDQGMVGANSMTGNVVRGLDGRKGRDGSVKFVVVSDQDPDIIVEQSVSMFALELTNFRIQRRIPKRTSGLQQSKQRQELQPPPPTQEQQQPPVSNTPQTHGRRQKVFGNLIIEDDDDEFIERQVGKSDVESTTSQQPVTSSAEEVIQTSKALAHNIEYDLVDLDEFAEPGSEIVISEIEVKNLGGLSTPENCLFTFKGNALFESLGFDKISLTPLLRNKARNSTSTMSEDHSDSSNRFSISSSNDYVKIPSLRYGETFSVSTPFIARIRRIDKESTHESMISEGITSPKLTSIHQECMISSEISHIPTQSLNWQNATSNAYSLQRVIANIPIQYPIVVSEISTPKTLAIGTHSRSQPTEKGSGAMIEVKLRNTSSVGIHNQVQIRIQIRMDEEAGEPAAVTSSRQTPQHQDVRHERRDSSQLSRQDPSSSTPQQQPESSAPSSSGSSQLPDKSYFFVVEKVSSLSLPPTLEDVSKTNTTGGNCQPVRSVLSSSSRMPNNARGAGKNDRSLLFNDQLSVIESVVMTSTTHLEEESQMVNTMTTEGHAKKGHDDDLFSIYQQQKERNEVFSQHLEILQPYSESSWVYQLKLFDLHKILMKRSKKRSPQEHQTSGEGSSSSGSSSLPLDELLGFCQGSIIISIYYKDCLLERRVNTFKCIPKTVQQVVAKGSFLNASSLGKRRAHHNRLHHHHQELFVSSSTSKPLYERYAVLLTSSEKLQNKSYVFYKRLLRELNLELIVWDMDEPNNNASSGDGSHHHPKVGGGSISNSTTLENHQLLTLFKDNLFLVTLFKAPQHDSTNSQFNSLIGQLLQKQQEFEKDRLLTHDDDDEFNDSQAPTLFFDGGILYISSSPSNSSSSSTHSNPFSNCTTPNDYLRHQVLNKCRPPVQMIEPKSLSIIYPFEKPSKKLFHEKVEKYLRKKQEENPSNVIQVHRKECFEISKSRMPRRILLGSCQYSILPVKAFNRIYRVSLLTNPSSSSTNSNKEEIEFTPDILESYHKFSVNSKTFALAFGIIMSMNIEAKVNLLHSTRRSTNPSTTSNNHKGSSSENKEWIFCDQGVLDVLTLKDISLFALCHDIIQELALRDCSFERFERLIQAVLKCFYTSSTSTSSSSNHQTDRRGASGSNSRSKQKSNTATESSSTGISKETSLLEEFLQHVKLFLDVLKGEVQTRLKKTDKIMTQRKREFLKLHTQLRKHLIEKCRSMVDSSRNKGSSKRLYRMLGGEALYMKRKQFGTICKYLNGFLSGSGNGVGTSSNSHSHWNMFATGNSSRMEIPLLYKWNLEKVFAGGSTNSSNPLNTSSSTKNPQKSTQEEEDQ
ncbi:hypothetical protein C9374_014300 [Naegleria lovaniensis]|uniref:Uncharacterized protein n=1 Tax=Naegleria lovaniensis TaxID=51637 RepID=A0AA88GB53_NAELO|nr:uncharacterized protein C9374_014300 [Naegleria lovaniensis]KAG2370709.1 hypothetical protein C9374_014300 [Naegleria lovaniensis]